MREDDCPQEPHRMTSFDQMQQSVSRNDMVLLGNCPTHPLLSCWTSPNPLELLGFHTAASLMIASGTDVTTVAGILGHAQPSTTLDIYSHAFEKNKREASAALQKELDI